MMVILVPCMVCINVVIRLTFCNNVQTHNLRGIQTHSWINVRLDLMLADLS